MARGVVGDEDDEEARERKRVRVVGPFRVALSNHAPAHHVASSPNDQSIDKEADRSRPIF